MSAMRSAASLRRSLSDPFRNLLFLVGMRTARWFRHREIRAVPDQ